MQQINYLMSNNVYLILFYNKKYISLNYLLFFIAKINNLLNDEKICSKIAK